MKRVLAVIYGTICYLIFLGAFSYFIPFIGDFLVPKTINSGETVALISSVFINLGLLGLFAVQHSGMARKGFKEWWGNFIPKPIERSTYVLVSSIVLVLMMWQWKPLPGTVWSIESNAGQGIMWGLFSLGWGLVLYTTFLISHAHLFGLKQVQDFMKKRRLWAPDFQTPALYKYVRHPMMFGFFLAFWATPEMTVGHLIFSISTTGYIIIALQLEEKDLIKAFGEQYKQYKNQIPMFIPRPWKKISNKQEGAEEVIAEE